jgi:hypothetical protein
MVWKCPSCGFDQNDESNMVCVCGFRYVPEVSHQDNSLSTSVPPQPDEIEDTVTKRDLFAIKGGYVFFAVVIVLTAIASRSLKFFISYVIPTAIVGFCLYKYKPKKTKLYLNQTTIKSTPEMGKNISKNELYILMFFVLIVPTFIATLNHKDVETFWLLIVVFVLGGIFVGTMLIVSVRVAKDMYKKRRP